MQAQVGMPVMDRLTDILGMVQSIETLTLAGQRSHNAVRITGLLEEEVARCPSGTDDPRTGTVASLLAELRREAKRLLPDIRCFTSHAEILIGLAQEMR
jgi:hypothetical protein